MLAESRWGQGTGSQSFAQAMLCMYQHEMGLREMLHWEDCDLYVLVGCAYMNICTILFVYTTFLSCNNAKIIYFSYVY